MVNLTRDFEDLFKTHYSALCNLAYNITKNEEAAEDIAQDVFLKMWQRRNNLQDIVNIKSYLFRAVANASIDYLKNNKNVIRLNPNDDVQPSADGEDAVIRKELEARIERALRLLPPKCRAIFVMSRHEGMKYKEIAEQLGISVKTVENQMGIALEKMRNELKPYLTKEFISTTTKTAVSVGNILFLAYIFFQIL
ncbi:MAG: polymerase sigma-70 factor [Bacteroidetes bacterium]|jgi:RNA polymerase sigma-70 factor (ECF subfamily)|nr:polymerase sigma-70 factor [Bacteroidota bacterium]